MEKTFTISISIEKNYVVRILMLAFVATLNLLMLGVEFFSALPVWQRIVLAVFAVVIIAFGVLLGKYGDKVKEIAHNSCVYAAVSAMLVLVVASAISFINDDDQMLTKTTMEFWAIGELLAATFCWLLSEKEKTPPVCVGILLNLVLLLPWLYIAFPEIRSAFSLATGIFLPGIVSSLWKSRRKLFR